MRVVKLDAAGQVVAEHTCAPAFAGRPRVAIDAAGAVYLIGAAWWGDTAIQFAAAYD